jgi:hypothetical protein
MAAALVVDMDVAMGDMVRRVEIKELLNATIPSRISSPVLHSDTAQPEELAGKGAMLEATEVDMAAEREVLDTSKIRKMIPVLPWISRTMMLLLLWILTMMILPQPWTPLLIQQPWKREDSRCEILYTTLILKRDMEEREDMDAADMDAVLEDTVEDLEERREAMVDTEDTVEDLAERREAMVDTEDTVEDLAERREALDMSKLRMTRLQVFSIVDIYKAPTTDISPHISF